MGFPKRAVIGQYYSCLNNISDLSIPYCEDLIAARGMRALGEVSVKISDEMAVIRIGNTIYGDRVARDTKKYCVVKSI